MAGHYSSCRRGPLLGTKRAGAGSEPGPWCGPLAEVGDGDAWVRARCGLGIIAETVRSGDVAFGYGGKNSVTDERNFSTNHLYSIITTVISVEILEPVEGDNGGNMLLPDGAIEVPVVARVVVPTAEAHSCSFRISIRSSGLPLSDDESDSSKGPLNGEGGTSGRYLAKVPPQGGPS